MSATRLRTWGLVLLCTLAVGAVWAGPQAHLPPQLQAACERARAEAMKPDSAHKANYTPTVTSSRDLPIVPNWSYTGTQELSYSGASVGSAGDVNGDGYNDVFISAPYYSDAYSTAGAVFVFHGSATGVSASPDWSAYGTMDEAHFGWSVAAAGDVNGDGYGDLIVGAPHHGANQEGRVSVYFGSASGLSSAEDWYASSIGFQDHFGSSVASAGDVNGDGYADIIIGAPNHYHIQQYEGWAFAYYGSNHGPNGGVTGTIANADWTAEGGEAEAILGDKVSCAGDVNGDGYSDVVVSAPLYDGGTPSADFGQVRVYHGSSSGLEFSPAWTAMGDRTDARLGQCVGTAGDVNGDGYSDIIVGSWYYSHEVLAEGLALLYTGSAAGLSAYPWWRTEGDIPGASFGTSAFTAGDVNGDGYADILVGASFYENGTQEEGGVFLWLGGRDMMEGGSSGTLATASWHTESGAQGARYGNSVSTAGDVNGDGFSDFIAGAYLYSSGMTNNGVSFLFYGAPEGLVDLDYWYQESNATSATMGISGTVVGDLNGDGYDDIALGAPDYNDVTEGVGAVLISFGSDMGLFSGSWSVRIVGGQQGSNFGWALAGPGDLNGDGYDDLIVGSPLENMGTEDEGVVYVFYGASDFGSGGTIPASNADWWAQSDQSGRPYFGNLVSGAGDVNGDGYADIAVSADEYDSTYTNEGAVFVWYGSASGLGALGTPANADWVRYGGGAMELLGTQVALAGDVNGDGFSDLAASESSGTVHVWHGSAAGLRATGSDWMKTGSGGFGVGLAGIGDVDGDGYGDLAIGSPLQTNSQALEGKCEAYSGSSAGLGASPTWIDWGGALVAYFGTSVVPAGDLNGDGYADFLVSAPLWTNGHVNEGQVRAYYGGPLGPVSFSGGDWTAEGNAAGAAFGWAIGGGDVNGDGISDALVGAPFVQGDLGEEGKAYLWYGCHGGRDMGVRQMQLDLSAPVGRFARTNSADSFQIQMTRRTVFGRTGMQLEWEVKPAGTAMDGTFTNVWGYWVNPDSGVPVLSAIANGLSANTAYHWRVRQLFRPTTCPWQRHGRWYTMAWRGGNQFLLRTAPGGGTATPTPTPTPTLTPTGTRTPTPSARFETGQQYSVDSDGHFYCCAFDFVSNTFISTVDTTGAADMAFNMTEDHWVGIYLYDYADGSWRHATYVLRDQL